MIRRLWAILRTGLMLLGGFTLAGLIGVGVLITGLADAPPKTPERAALIYDFAAPPPEQGAADPIAADLLGLARGPRLRDVVAGLDAAASDPQIAGFALRLKTDLPMATAQEIAAAVTRFRATGKPTLIHARDLMGPGGIVLAAAFDEIVLRETGTINYVGFGFDRPYAAAAFAELGIAFEFAKRGDYKTAFDAALREEGTRADRAQAQALMDGWVDQLTAAMALGRALPLEAARRLMDDGPYFGAAALQAGLADRLAYWPETQDAFIAALEAEPFGFEDYLAGREADDAAATIAVIPVLGPIGVGGGFGAAEAADGEALGEALRDAAADDAVDAVLIRVDSPGGTYPASDAIRAGVLAVRAADKPVVASMAGLAASGGYFAAMAADRVFAQPATVTGSIGVLAGKPNLAGLWAGWDVNWEETAAGGAQANAYSPHRPFTPAQRAKLEASADAVYADFVGKAAVDRGMTGPEMEARAQGRVWTGVAAVENGLIDGLGGYTEALDALRDALDLPPDAPLALEDRPAPPNAFEALSRFTFGIAADAQRARAALDAAARVMGPLEGVFAGEDQRLRAPPLPQP